MQSVLIVDDDLLLADRLEEILIQAGYEVCGIAGTVEEAISLGEQYHPDLGVIDVHLAHGGLGTEVAVALRRHGAFGVLYSTGDSDSLGTAEGDGYLMKPYPASSVISALSIVGDLIAGRAVTSAFPSEFRRLVVAQRPVLRGEG